MGYNPWGRKELDTAEWFEHTQANVCITLRKQTRPRLGEQFAQGCHVSYGKANSPISLHFINYLVLFHVFLAGIKCLHLPPTPCHSLEILISPVCCQIAQTEIMRILFANWWGQMDHEQERRSAVVSNTKTLQLCFSYPSLQYGHLAGDLPHSDLGTQAPSIPGP